MEYFLKNFESYSITKLINIETINWYENISKLCLFQILEKLENEEMIEFIKEIQKKCNKDNEPYIYKTECIICYEINTGVLTLCNHFVCFDCYLKMACTYDKLDCPMCRRDINTYIFESVLCKIYSKKFKNYLEEDNVSNYSYNDIDNMMWSDEDDYNDIIFQDVHIDIEDIEDIDEWANNIEIDHYLSGA